MTRAIALLALLSTVAAADTKVPGAPVDEVKAMWPDLDRYEVWVRRSGKFSNAGSRDFNLINAPVSAIEKEPPPLPIDAAALDALNREVDGVLHRLLVEHRLRVREGQPANWVVNLMALSVELGASNGMGGHHGGLDVVMKLTLERLGPQSGVRTLVTIAPPSPTGQGNLLMSLEGALARGLAELLRGVHAAMQQPVGHMQLVVSTDNLDEAQREHIVKAVVPCALETIAARSTVISKGQETLTFDVEVRLRQGERGPQFARRWKGQMEGAIGAAGKYRCSLWRGPLEGHQVVVGEAYRGMPALLVRFVKP